MTEKRRPQYQISVRKIYLFLLTLLILAGCVQPDTGTASRAPLNYGQEIRSTAVPYLLNLTEWEMNNLLRPDLPGESSPVMPGLQSRITRALRENGIATFPPVRFRLENPPCLLVVSPRDRIAYFDRVMLRNGMTPADIEHVEQRVDALGFSSLVVELGGFGGAYPAIVSPDMSEKHVINAAVEEWAHQYLALRPLGFLYLLDSIGIRQNPTVIEMNETLAGIIADEIGTQVYETYCKIDAVNEGLPAGIDFAAEMRLTRKTADAYLAEGRIAEAEQYMQGRRDFFNQNGYDIRKLNQAYFAFHGIYGQDPGSVSPVYEDMKTLRRGYHSLAGFMADVSAMTGYENLQRALSGGLRQ
ncbi:MAG: hypothetical protein PHO26_02235 [Dehalococcoidia bacterium]|nr:hypothetical protein [Dehalococcoidia bacterium]